ncbi:MAG: tape measure protein [Oscillospiraceae bacterium]|jgi:tape measure domain-containing protein|nr:tape measure protein [Oscillospiraceae bacterium]
MAVIREEMVLADRFSATFNRYLGMLRQSSSASTAATAGQRQFEAASGKTQDALVRMAGAALDAASAMGGVDESTAQAAAAGEQAARSQDKMNRSMRQGVGAAAGLESRLLSLAKAYLGLRTAQKFVELTDTFTQTTARLERMNDGLQTTAELQNMIYQSAQRSRGSYQEMADMVGKLGTMAGEAFDSNTELVAFAEQINKQFALAGTSGQGMQAAMLQLTQAMSSGVLRGEELNSVLEQAPTIAQTIAKYMGKTMGEMRELASQGQITATVVKNAIFDVADKTDKAFEKIPLTFGQAWTMAGNAAVKAMQPAMKRLTDLLNSDLGKKAVNGLIAGFELLGRGATGVIDLLAAGAQWVADNWDFVSRVLQFAGGAVLAFAAVSVGAAIIQAGAWALANWPIVLFIALMGAAVMAMYEMGMSSEEVFGTIGAGLGWLYALGYNLTASAWNLIATFAEFFANVFDNPVTAIANLFLGLFNFIMDIVTAAAGAIDALLGSNISGAVKGFQADVNNFVHDVFGENQVKVQRMEQISYQDTMAGFAGAGAGIGLALDNFNVNDVLGGFSGSSTDFSALLDASGVPGSLDAIQGDTAAIKRSVALSEEDMKLLVDMAERRYVNNINLTAQTPVITINGQNTGDTAQDLQWLENALQRILAEQAASHTDLSYV